jgi:hypothetical protein
MISEFSRLLPVQLGQLIRLCELITFRAPLCISAPPSETALSFDAAAW